MVILIEKMFAQLLFWLYQFIDMISTIFNILTGTQSAGKDGQTLLEMFLNEGAIVPDIMFGLCIVGVVIAGACVGVKTVKNVIKFKAGGEATSHATTIKQGVLGIGASVVCIFFVFMFIAFSSMLLNMVNDVLAPSNNISLSGHLFNLSVEESYVLDENVWEERVLGEYYDESGNRVQAKDPESPDGLAWEVDDDGNYVRDEKGSRIPIYVQSVEYFHPYLTKEDGSYVTESGWIEGYTVENIEWTMSPDEVFGVHKKDALGFEKANQGYTKQPMVRLESFNLFTAYLVAVLILIAMFMLSVGLVKRIYDIIVLIFCMPLVCGTIALDDGARFRAWRETFMSKVLIAFGAVIAINVFLILAEFIIGTLDLMWLVNQGILSSLAVAIFKMLLLVGGGLCINSSQTLIARILGTSADEGREAMQSFALITSAVRMAGVGAGVAGFIGRKLFGGTNRYGRKTTGLLNYAARGVNAIGERAGGEKYSGSRLGRFVRVLGRMNDRSSPFGSNGAKSAAGDVNGKKSGLTAPNAIKGVGGAAAKAVSGRSIGGGLRTGANDSKSGAFKDDSARRN